MRKEASLKLARDWSDAAFGGPSRPPTVTVERWNQSWESPKHGKSIVAEPLCIGGRVFPSGLGTHADSEIVLKLPGAGKRFSAFAGMDRNSYSLTWPSQEGRIVFSIEAGGKELWASKPLGLADPPLEVGLNLAGARELTLKTREINGNIALAHADWADIRIECENGGVMSVGIPMGMPVGKVPLRGTPSISFRMGDWSSPEVLARSRFAVKRLPSGDGLSRNEAVWDDPVTGLAVMVEVTECADLPAVEYVLRLKNNGQADTPVIEDILSADFSWPVAKTPTMLYRSRGSTALMEDFLYSKTPIAPGASVRMAPVGVDGMRGEDGRDLTQFVSSGRSSDVWLPFFNIETGKEGFVMAIGWTGAWLAEFEQVDEDSLKIRAGLERTRLRLHPGEEIRLPRILLVFWEDEPLNGHNLLRRFLVRHGTPRPGGRPPVTPISYATWGGTPTSTHLRWIAKLAEEHLECDCYWVDADWYGPARKAAQESQGEWSKWVGHWAVNPVTHPDGLRPIGEAARKAGMKFLLWLEPERAQANTPWRQEHPEWFLPAGGRGFLLNLGIPEARRFVTDYVSDLIAREGVDIYRQDFNMAPLPSWLAADAPDRQGMTEIRFIEGLYEFWDELLRRHPGLLIDNCASGGKRIDIETIRRSIPLHRTDYHAGWDPIGRQIQGMGLNYWVPFSGDNTAIRPNDTYDFRSSFAACVALFPMLADGANDMPKDYPWPWLRTMIGQLKRCRPAFAGDYYPLLPSAVFSDDWTEQRMRAARYPGGDHAWFASDIWAAYQMHRADLGEGFVVALRRDKSPFLSAQLVLKGLDGKKRYGVEDADTGEKREIGGAVLLSEGLRVEIPEPRGSRLFFLRAL
ncbi:MAG: alpha-galactosidase [Kiritimatiellae bacterium]|nr:alpha-galactosidase [Kiritimatiellia bacterium]